MGVIDYTSVTIDDDLMILYDDISDQVLETWVELNANSEPCSVIKKRDNLKVSIKAGLIYLKQHLDDEQLNTENQN